MGPVQTIVFEHDKRFDLIQFKNELKISLLVSRECCAVYNVVAPKISSTTRRLNIEDATAEPKLLCFDGLTLNLGLLTTDDPIDCNTLNATQLKLMNSHEIR